MSATVPEKPSLEGLEAKWAARWEADGTFRFDRSKARSDIYAIDTPPPTVSGKLHIGHCFSYTQTDFVARFRRMFGAEVFYPMGWDDNGLNVERRTQLMRGIICDPSLPYDPDFRPADPPPKDPVAISRPNFVEQCGEVTEFLEQAFHELWSTMGLSVDWSLTYTTIGAHATRTSQLGFLNLLERGLIYRVEAPTTWDVDFKTAVAQAEIEDRERPGAYHRIKFHRPDGGDIQIETTRPELLPACVALVAHPDDDRYKPLFGTEVSTPLFSARVPVLAHSLADPEKGSGIAMICTFGDSTDVVWWRELSLPVRAVVGPDGRLLPVTWGAPGWECDDPDRAAAAYAELHGRTVKQAQRRIVDLLTESGDLVGEPKPITHPVKFWENGTNALEIVTNRQWFVRYPPKDDLLEYGRQLEWHPSYMQVRYENWVNGLMGDWNITRQRFFGVPFPVWYPIGDDGEIDNERFLTAPPDRLPVDPSTDVPDGYTEDQRGQPGGFVGDPDVMDTWATSSLTPQIIGHWADDPDLFERVFPMDVRPQAHDIIRTWLFYTIVRAHYEHGQLPWTNAIISGFVNDPDRKKLSKSAGNSPDDPMNVIAENGADAVRYWAANARTGTDVTFDRNQVKIGRRLAIKLLNASKFVLSRMAESGGGRLGDTSEVTEALDRAMLSRLATTVADATVAFEAYDYTKALERAETFFWTFCDDYLELVKTRAYGGTGAEAERSATAALSIALSTLLRLFAPFLPFVTEEVWSWWREGSVHRAGWPVESELRVSGDDSDAAYAVAADVLGHVRRAKTEAKQSMKAAVRRVTVTDTSDRLAALKSVESDIRDAGTVAAVDVVEGDTFLVEVELDQPAA